MLTKEEGRETLPNVFNLAYDSKCCGKRSFLADAISSILGPSSCELNDHFCQYYAKMGQMTYTISNIVVFSCRVLVVMIIYI